MNSMLEIDDILGTVLRGIYETVHFGRVLLFEMHDGAAVRRLETGSEGVVTTSVDAGPLRMTETLRAILDGSQQYAVGRGDDACPVGDCRVAYCALPLMGRQAVRGVLYADDPPSGEVTDAQLRMLLDFASQAAIAMENARLLSETRRLLAEMERLAAVDPLTGVANRRSLAELMERELYNAARYRIPAALLLFDLDDFKQINDTGGHLAGDEALKNFASVLQKASRRGDVVARYGGDEFVLFMSYSDRDAARSAVGRFYGQLEQRGLHCSVGIAVFPEDGARAEDLFHAADRALYAAKAAGKNRFEFASEPG